MELKILGDNREKLIASIRKNKFNDFDKLSSVNSPKEYLIYFIRCFDLLKRCSHDLTENTDLSAQLIKYIESLQKLYDEILELSFKFDIIFGRYTIDKQIEKLFLENKTDIVDIVSFIYPLGTITRMYDPDKYSGAY